MKIKLNGQDREYPRSSMPIAKLLKAENVENPETVMVQLNGEFVKKEDYETIEVREADEIEFLYYMGGGQNRIHNLEPILKQHQFFKDLKPEYFEFIVGCASNVIFKQGDFIFRENEPADYFYLIREGLVAIEIAIPGKKPVVIQTVGPGDILGWSWFFSPYKARFNCRSNEEVRAISLDGKCLRDKCEKNHDLGYELFKRLAKVFTDRLEATRMQLLSLYD